MPQQHVVDISLLGTVARRVFSGARSVSVEPAYARFDLRVGGHLM